MPKFRYRMIADALLNDIRSGELTPGVPVPSSRDLCKLYGVSHLTAIHALNYLAKKGVLTHYPGKNYCVSHKIDKASRPWRFITLLFRHISTTGSEFYGNGIIGGVTTEAASASVSTLFASSTAQSIYLKEKDFSSTFLEVLALPRQNMGLVVDYFIPDEILAMIQEETRLPAVVIGRESKLPMVHSVYIDPFPAYATMLYTLKRLGYEHFICCEKKDLFRWENKAQQDFYRQLAEKETVSIISQVDYLSSSRRLEILERLLHTHSGKRSVILASSDEEARWFMEHLGDLNRSVPEEIGVVGFYGTRLATDFSPKLTTISVRPESLGLLAAQLLISGDRRFHSHKIPMKFVFGETI